MQASELHKQLVIIDAQEIHIYRCIIKKEYDKFILYYIDIKVTKIYDCIFACIMYPFFTSFLQVLKFQRWDHNIDDNSDFGSFYMMLNEIF